MHIGDSYHSAGLMVCNRKDIQGFSVIPIRERVKYITDTMEYKLEGNTNGDEEDLSFGARLSFTKNSPHVKFVHFNAVTPTKTPIPPKAAKYDRNSPLDTNLFKFSLSGPQDTSNNLHDDSSIVTETFRHSCAPNAYTMEIKTC